MDGYKCSVSAAAELFTRTGKEGPAVPGTALGRPWPILLVWSSTNGVVLATAGRPKGKPTSDTVADSPTFRCRRDRTMKRRTAAYQSNKTTNGGFQLTEEHSTRNADRSEKQSVPASEVVSEDETVLAAFDYSSISCSTPWSSIQAPSTHESRAQHRSAFHITVK